MGGVGKCIKPVPPRPVCKLEGQFCGTQATNPPKHYGSCCPDLTCHHRLLGGAGKCIKPGILSQ